MPAHTYPRRLARVVAIAVAVAITASACSGGAPEALRGPLPTPTPLRPTLAGSPLDAIDDPNNPDPSTDAASSDDQSAGGGEEGQIDPDAIDCTVHAEDPSSCRPTVDGLDAIRFDDSLWSYTQDGFPVYTNVTEPYAIEHVVAATIEAARAELAGQNQALFPHLANRRLPPPYVDIGIWSVTFLFAADPVADPAQVKVAIEGTTADGQVVDELVTYLWQWTPERWIPEWETFIQPDPEPLADTDPEPADSGTDSTDGAPRALDEPPAGAAWCPPGFPYAHKNGKCYANPINPADQVGGPPVTAPLPVPEGAPFIPPADD